MNPATAVTPYEARDVSRSDRRDRHPSLGRLVEVELRKATDTRAGFWLLLSLMPITVALVVMDPLSAETGGHTLRSSIAAGNYGLRQLLPVIGILAVTSEWSQRTALATFGLVPGRRQVILAKTLAVSLIALAAGAIAIAIAVVGYGFREGVPGSGGLTVALVGQALLFHLLNVLCGVAFGLLLLSSAPAIALFILLPPITEIVFGFGLYDEAHWFVLGYALQPLSLDAGITGQQWTQLVTSSAVWVGLPMLAGLMRLARREIK
jgi:ABC-2 type transport system permease protein